MEPEDEERWRDALRQRGKEYVQGELRRRYGGPDDAVLDIVFEPPFPTRAFCSRWCAEEDNRLFSFSKNTVMIIAATLILFVAVIHLVQSFNELDYVAQRQAKQLASQNKQPSSGNSKSSGSSGGGSGSADASNTTTPAGQSSFVQAGQQDGSSGGSATASSTDATAAAVCAYIPYPTERCPQADPSASSSSGGYGSPSGSSSASSSTSGFGASAYSGSTSPDTNQPIGQGTAMSTGYGAPSNYNAPKAR